MFLQLKLKNFRQHIDLTVLFEQGLIALRGANEKGKTTLLEAILFAMGGARTLREPLPEVVTWGQKESSLKVWLDFIVNGVTYSVIRSKSGAEIRIGERIEATGQDDVTRYIERLLGCTIKVAMNLMLASQQKLRGTLEEDGAAVKLIEALANFALIDQIIGLVQEKLPNGSTAAVDARIAMLEEQIAAPILDNTSPMQEIVTLAEARLVEAEIAYSTERTAYDELQEPARDAQERINRAATAAQVLAGAAARLQQAKTTHEAIVPVPGPSDDEIASLRREVEDVNRFSRACRAYDVMHAIPEPSDVWEGTLDSLEADLQQQRNLLTKINASISTAKEEIARLTAMQIKETACGLCGKDLRNVPEVVAKNADIAAQLSVQESIRSTETVAAAEATQMIQTLEGIKRAHYSFMTTYQQAAEFVRLDHSFVPPVWEWTGPDVSERVMPAALEMLRQAEAKAQAYQRDVGRKEQAQAALLTAQQAFWDAEAAATATSAAAEGTQDVLAAFSDVTTRLYGVETSLREAQQAVQQAQQGLESERALVRERQAAKAALVDQLALTKKDKTEIAFNNDLIKALRSARPAITEELWNIVGGSVSSYFSDIRGQKSVFTRDGDSFKVDGRGVKGLSGSTLDALGLAIRMALTTMFLPNTRFMVLDEPAAACDDGRELNMLGVIASSPFDQTILVTHSDLADSFAAQVIQL